MKNKRKFISIIVLTLINFYSCQKVEESKNVKADLTFKSITFASAYGATKDQYEEYIKEMDSVLRNEGLELSKEKIKLYKYHSKLRDHDLLRLPYIFLHFGKDSVITVYVSENEYEKVKNIKHIDLLNEGKKAIIELEMIKKDSAIYYSDNIIDISKVKGKSRSNI
ncbi:hypothetical protein U6A24_18070 [Aquimarina gracilis]|uniref:Uncharacterized protein n=1 Tax=Aquimarina gracilis TaxID=874422 RepID=A0ABU5ZZU0_9FLAO|nr:hypothetical protein [Aquimarina gracilis]MEB3347387.1 hypothetical protein [Aquimarina gracilis]